MAAVAVDELAKLPLPPFQPLAGSEIGSFAHGTISKRLPSIVETIVTEVQSVAGSAGEVEPVLQGLRQLQIDMANNAAVTPVPAQGVQSSEGCNLSLMIDWTNNCLASYAQVKQQSTWWDLPWLVVECYMYVRIAQLLRSCPALGPAFDPFASQKLLAFQKSAAAATEVAAATKAVLQAPGIGERGSKAQQDAVFEVMQYSLWGNKTDLSMLVDASNIAPASLVNSAASSAASSAPTPFLIADDFPAIWTHLTAPSPSSPSARRVDIILDNAGLELFGDLCLADLLLTAGLADSIVLHGKQLPWFVSDVLEHDFHELLQLAAESEDEAVRWLGARWAGYVREGKWSYTADPFWTSPFPFCWMQAISPQLYEQLQGSHLVCFKGDLNYRKLAYDCRWPLTVPFREGLMGFEPAPLVSLRTLKADVVVGLAEGQGEALTAVDKDWMVNGKFGVIQAAL